MARSSARTRSQQLAIRASLAEQVQGHVRDSTVWAEMNGDTLAFAVIPAAVVPISPRGIDVWASRVELHMDTREVVLTLAYYGEASESEMLARLDAADDLGMDMWWLDHEEGWIEIIDETDCQGGIRSEP